MNAFVTILISAVLTDNLVFTKLLGIRPLLGGTGQIKTALRMSGAALFVMTLAAAVAQPIHQFLLAPFGLGDLLALVTAVLVVGLCMLIALLLKGAAPKLYERVGVYLPVVAVSSATIGMTLQNAVANFSFLEAVMSGFSGGIGFALALMLFAGIRQRIREDSVPAPFRGLPITLIAAGLVSLVFSGLSGLVDRLTF